MNNNTDKEILNDSEEFYDEFEDFSEDDSFDSSLDFEDENFESDEADNNFENEEKSDAESENEAPQTIKKSGFIAKISDKLEGKKYLFFCFLVPAFIMTLIYAFMRVFPFGTNSVLVLDLNGQYVYYFEALRDIITEGGSLLYSFKRALGGEFMGIFAYYLSSPLSIIVALFPKEYMTEALYFMFVLKCGLCGLSFGYYVHKTRKKAPAAAVLFSSMYALCSYAVVMQHNTMWTDNLILLPLIMLGIEHLIKGGGIFRFVIPLAIAVFSNFYIGYMMCIFSAVYFFIYYFSKTREEIDPLKTKAHFLKSLGKTAIGGILAVCICAIIILPTYYSLSFGKNDFSEPQWALTQKFDFADVFTKFFFNSYDTVRPEGLPFLYTGTLTLLLAPAYFFCKNIKLREKITSGVLLVFFFFSMNASTLDLLWHGMQKPNWLNYRYAFMLCFFLVLMAHRVFENIREIKFAYIGASAIGVIGIIIILQKFEYENLPDLTSVWVTIGAALLFTAILKAASSPKEITHSTAVLVLVLLVSFELFTSGLLNLFALDEDVKYSGRTGYRNFIDKTSIVTDDIKESDTSFYRTEKTFHRKTNDNLALGINGLSNSTSTLDAKAIEFLNRMGFSSKSHWSKYLGRTPVADSILGVKYVITELEDEPLDFYNPVKEYENVGYVYYENPYALPIAYGVSRSYLSASIGDDGMYPSPLSKMNHLVNQMLGEENGKGVFTGIEQDAYTTNNLSEIYTTDHIKYEPIDADSASSVTYFVTTVYDGPLYCYFPSEYLRESTLFINGEQSGTYFGNETYRIVDLGTYKSGETVTVRLELKKSTLYIYDRGYYFWQTDPERFVYAMEKLAQSPFEITKHSDTALSGTINVKEGNEQIFTSIPYDEGWKVYCDGEKLEISEGAEALITFELPEGQHTLEFKYRPYCVKYGALISVFGLSSAVLLGAAQIILNKKEKEKEIPQNI